MAVIVNDPYDKFFKTVFGQVKNDHSFIENYLSREIVQYLQLDLILWS